MAKTVLGRQEQIYPHPSFDLLQETVRLEPNQHSLQKTSEFGHHDWRPWQPDG